MQDNVALNTVRRRAPRRPPVLSNAARTELTSRPTSWASRSPSSGGSGSSDVDCFLLNAGRATREQIGPLSTNAETFVVPKRPRWLQHSSNAGVIDGANRVQPQGQQNLRPQCLLPYDSKTSQAKLRKVFLGLRTSLCHFQVTSPHRPNSLKACPRFSCSPSFFALQVPSLEREFHNQRPYTVLTVGSGGGGGVGSIHIYICIYVYEGPLCTIWQSSLFCLYCKVSEISTLFF